MSKLDQAMVRLAELEAQNAELQAELSKARKVKNVLSTSEKIKSVREKYKIVVVSQDKDVISKTVGRVEYKDGDKTFYKDINLINTIYAGSTKSWREANPQLAEYASAFERGTVFTVGNDPQEFYCHCRKNGMKEISKVQKIV